jgi:hypothetical protein
LHIERGKQFFFFFSVINCYSMVILLISVLYMFRYSLCFGFKCCFDLAFLACSHNMKYVLTGIEFLRSVYDLRFSQWWLHWYCLLGCDSVYLVRLNQCVRGMWHLILDSLFYPEQWQLVPVRLQYQRSELWTSHHRW